MKKRQFVNTIPLLLLCGILAARCLSGCTEKKTAGYTLKERILISQMVQDSVLVHFPVIDSLCTAGFEDKVKKMADSLYPVRLEQMLKQRQQEVSKKRGE